MSNLMDDGAKIVGVEISNTAVDVVSAVVAIDKDCPGDEMIDYKKLYYAAFNGMSDIISGNEDDPHPIVNQIKALQYKLESDFMEYK